MPRRVLLLTHTGREDACEVALACCRALSAHGIVVRMPPDEMADLGISADDPEIRVEPAAEGDQADKTGFRQAGDDKGAASGPGAVRNE